MCGRNRPQYVIGIFPSFGVPRSQQKLKTSWRNTWRRRKTVVKVQPTWAGIIFPCGFARLEHRFDVGVKNLKSIRTSRNFNSASRRTRNQIIISRGYRYMPRFGYLPWWAKSLRTPASHLASLRRHCLTLLCAARKVTGMQRLCNPWQRREQIYLKKSRPAQHPSACQTMLWLCWNSIPSKEIPWRCNVVWSSRTPCVAMLQETKARNIWYCNRKAKPIWRSNGRCWKRNAAIPVVAITPNKGVTGISANCRQRRRR